MKTVQEEFSFLSIERCSNRFVGTRTVLLKAVKLAYAAIWKVVKGMHVYIPCFTLLYKKVLLRRPCITKPRSGAGVSLKDNRYGNIAIIWLKNFSYWQKMDVFVRCKILPLLGY